MPHQRVSRRAFLAGTAAAGLTAAAPRGRPVEAADPKVLRVRSYENLEALDPAFQLSAPEGDIIDAILLGLVTVKPGDTWGWERDARAVDRAGRSDPHPVPAPPGDRLDRRLRRGHRRGRQVLVRADRQPRNEVSLPRGLGEARPGAGHRDPHRRDHAQGAVHPALVDHAPDGLFGDRVQEGRREDGWPALHDGPGRDLRALPDPEVGAAPVASRSSGTPSGPGPPPAFDEIQAIGHRRRQRRGDRLRGRPDRRDPRADDLGARASGASCRPTRRWWPGPG